MLVPSTRSCLARMRIASDSGSDSDSGAPTQEMGSLRGVSSDASCKPTRASSPTSRRNASPVAASGAQPSSSAPAAAPQAPAAAESGSSSLSAPAPATEPAAAAAPTSASEPESEPVVPVSRDVVSLTFTVAPITTGAAGTTVTREPLLPPACPALSVLVGPAVSARFAELLVAAELAPIPAPVPAAATAAAAAVFPLGAASLRLRPVAQGLRCVGGLTHPALGLFLLRSIPGTGDRPAALAVAAVAAVAASATHPIPGATGLTFPPFTAALDAAAWETLAPGSSMVDSSTVEGAPVEAAQLTWLVALISQNRVVASARVPALVWAEKFSAIARKSAELSAQGKLSAPLSFKRPLQHPTNDAEWAGIFAGEKTQLLVEPVLAP